MLGFYSTVIFYTPGPRRSPFQKSGDDLCRNKFAVRGSGSKTARRGAGLEERVHAKFTQLPWHRFTLTRYIAAILPIKGAKISLSSLLNRRDDFSSISRNRKKGGHRRANMMDYHDLYKSFVWYLAFVPFLLFPNPMQQPRYPSFSVSIRPLLQRYFSNENTRCHVVTNLKWSIRSRFNSPELFSVPRGFRVDSTEHSYTRTKVISVWLFQWN